MKHLLLAVCVLVPSAVSAQVPDLPSGACARCGVYAYADNLELENVPVVNVRDNDGYWQIDGWGFECVSGHPIDRIDVWYLVPDATMRGGGYWVSALNTYPSAYGPRPDVVDAYKAWCPSLAFRADAGFSALYKLGRIPLGVQTIRLIFWRGSLKTFQDRRVRFQ